MFLYVSLYICKNNNIMKQKYRITILARKLKEKSILSLNLKIAIDRHIGFYSLKEQVKVSDWDYNSNALKKSFSLYHQVTEKINDHIKDCRQFIDTNNNQNVAVNPNDVIHSLSSSNVPETIKYLIAELNKKWLTVYNSGNPSTAASYKSTLHTFTEYLQSINLKDIATNRLNEDFFQNFVDYLTPKHQNTTILKKIDHIHFLIRYGIDNGYFKKDPTTYIKKTLSAKSSQKLHDKVLSKNIDIDIIETIKSLPPSISKNVFLFQSYTGLAFVDILKLKYSDIKSIIIEGKSLTYVTKRRTKTNSTFNLIIPPEAIEILNLYTPTPHRTVKGLAIPTPSYSIYRLDLINIGKQINKHLTSHMARYSFINIARDKGYSDEYIANAVGHNSNEMIKKVYAGELSIKRQAKEYFTINQ